MDRLQSTLTDARSLAAAAQRHQREARVQLDAVPGKLRGATARAAAVATALRADRPHPR